MLQAPFLKNGSASTENLFDDFNTLVESILEKKLNPQTL